MVSIVTVTFNARDHVVNCLASVVEARPMDGTYEHIVVDNASDDGTAEAVAAFDGVILLRSEENAGFARGANAGMSTAGGDYLLLLNPDCILPQGAVEGLVRFMEEHPGVGAASPMLVTPEGAPQISYARFPRLLPHLLGLSPLGWLLPRRLKDIGFSGVPPSLSEQDPRPVDAPAGSCLLVRRAALDATGGMDERFFTYYEDIDWAYRMARAGWQRYYVPAVRVVHDMGATWRTLPQGLQLARSYEGKYIYFSARHGPGAGALVRWTTLVCARLNLFLAALLSVLGFCNANWQRKRAFNRMLLSAHHTYSIRVR
ncbi:glycosyltransferase family 2 protein [Candidatus Fermentibacteria bacterium]|nr:glycosyltransferase family 2 protein [Candidatus Fermentibacteria bacterium]